MNWSTFKTVIIILAIGVGLAILKIVYLFFDFYNVLDLIVFLVAGFAIGKQLSSHRIAFGLLLSLPPFLLCLFIVIGLGYSSIAKGIGTAYAVSLIVIPLATCIGILISAKRPGRGEHKRGV